jgi:hypothetical protein
VTIIFLVNVKSFIHDIRGGVGDKVDKNCAKTRLDNKYILSQI